MLKQGKPSVTMAMYSIEDESSDEITDTSDWTFIIDSGRDIKDIMRKYWWRFVPELQSTQPNNEVEKKSVEDDPPLLPLFTGIRFVLGSDKHTH